MELKITIKDKELSKLIELNKRLEQKKLQDTIRFIIKTYKLE
jgi:hypothetical protein